MWISLSVFTFSCCVTTVLQTYWLKTTHIYHLQSQWSRSSGVIHLGSLLGQSCGLIWGSPVEGFTSKFMWLYWHSFPSNWGPGLLTHCQSETVLSFLTNKPSQRGHLLPQIQQWRESPCKMNITVSCNVITKVIYPHLAIFYWLEESHRPSAQSKGKICISYINGRVYLPSMMNCPCHMQHAIHPISSFLPVLYHSVTSPNLEPYSNQTQSEWVSLGVVHFSLSILKCETSYLDTNTLGGHMVGQAEDNSYSYFCSKRGKCKVQRNFHKNSEIYANKCTELLDEVAKLEHNSPQFLALLSCLFPAWSFLFHER